MIFRCVHCGEVGKTEIRKMKLKETRPQFFDNNWIEFKKLIDKIDKAYDEVGYPWGAVSSR